MVKWMAGKPAEALGGGRRLGDEPADSHLPPGP